jgi:hypothetical protein
MIDERLDVVVWLATLVLFLLLGARAWAVETAESRHYRTSARVRVLNGASALAIVALVGLLAMQGGILMVQAIITDSDPRDLVTLVRSDEDAARSGAPAADPAAPPADPNAPPADPNAPAGANPPAGDANAPAVPPG